VSEIDIETAVASAPMSRRFRLALATLVGAAAISAAFLAWLEADSGQREEEAFVEASRRATEASVSVAASQPKLNFETAALRESTLLSSEATARAAAVQTDPLPLTLALSMSIADNDASRRLVEVTRAMAALPDGAEGLDDAASSAIRLEAQDEVEAIYAEQEAELDRAETYGARQERAIFGLGLVAIGASLLGVAGLTGEGRAGRAMLGTSAAAIAVALVAAVSALA
jgi:hypothetical protein